MIRYAVVGLGHIAQSAILPAFAQARQNSALAALVSDDPKKLTQLSRRYGVRRVCSYEDADDLFHSGQIDAVYITLPNSMHREYTERAARAGLHVLRISAGPACSHRLSWAKCTPRRCSARRQLSSAGARAD
ncbi:MAG: Gfo/Idh/MocA family oxidoreductase [Steroidobacteraceae bacterium]